MARRAQVIHPGAAPARFARAVGRTKLGHAAGRVAYEALARAAARALVRDPCVNAVYLTGSLAEGAVRVGWSDVDLVLQVTLDGPDDELALRERLRRWLRRWNAAGPVFASLDYLTATELDALRLRGDAWSLDLDVRWRCLAGHSRLRDAVPRSSAERRLLRFSKLLSRWVKVGGWAMRSPDDAAACRVLRRTLQQALAVQARVARHIPLEQLAPNAPTHREGLLEACGESLAATASEVSATWHAEPRTKGRLPPVYGAAPGARAAVALSRDIAGRERWLVGLHERAKPLRGHATVWMTDAMWTAISALEPAPIAGWSAHLEAAWLQGEARPVRAPSDADLAVLLDAARTTWRTRARGRMLRARVPLAQGLARMRGDISLWAPATAALARGEPLVFGATPRSTASEAALVRALHAEAA